MARKPDQYAKAELGGIELVHLFEGDCLIGGGCRICDQMGDGPDAVRIMRVAFVRELWALRKRELTAAWMERVEARGEPWAYFPWFVEVVCGGSTLPPFNPEWPQGVKERYTTIAANLAVLDDWRRARGVPRAF